MREPLVMLRALLCEQGLDAAIVTRTSDLRWLTGWEYVFDSERAHAALITSAEAVLHTDGRYATAMRERNTDGLWQISDEQVGHAAVLARILRESELNKVCGQHELHIAIEDDLPLKSFRAFEKAFAPSADYSTAYVLSETDGLVLKLRAVKTPEELDLLRQAQVIADTAFTALLEKIRPGLTELEIATEFEYLMKTSGADGLAFPTIVASGPHAANPHAVPTARKFEKGDLVVLDFGARWKDYCSDTTRTISIGKPSQEQLALYQAVLAAHDAAKAFIRAGVTGAQTHECALRELQERGYAERFIHSLGHGVGIEVHEFPLLNLKAEAPLVAGNVVTVEPGVYLPGVAGVRIEDCGAVTAMGFESFTALPHDFLIV